MKRVVFCRSNPVAPDPRVEKEARALNEHGFQVAIVAWDRESHWPVQEERSGIALYRLPIRAPFGHGLANLPGLMRWQFGLLGWLLRYHSSFDIIHACDFDTVLPAMLCKALCRKLVVYDIFDFYADHLRATPALLKTLIRKLDLWIAQRADAVILVDEVRQAQLQGIRPKRLVVLYNSPEDAVPACDEMPQPSAAFRIAYVGLLQVERGLLELLAVLRRHPDWHLDLAGFGGDAQRILQEAQALPNVSWHGRIPYEQALCLNKNADVLIATYDPRIPNHRYTSPNKLFEAMLLGRPIVVAESTHVDEIVLQEECGLVIPYGDVEALDQALTRLAQDVALRASLGTNGRRAYLEKYGWSLMRSRLLNLYASLFPQ